MVERTIKVKMNSFKRNIFFEKIIEIEEKVSGMHVFFDGIK